MVGMLNNDNRVGAPSGPAFRSAYAGAAGDPDAIAARVTRSQHEYFMQRFAPIWEELVGELNSTELVDQARDTAQEQSRVSTEVLNRSMSRYALAGAPGAVRDRLNRHQALGSSAEAAQSVNTARLAQHDRNMGLAQGLMQTGRGISASAQSGLAASAANEAARRSANEANKTAASNANRQMFGQLAGSVAMLAFAGI